MKRTGLSTRFFHAFAACMLLLMAAGCGEGDSQRTVASQATADSLLQIDRARETLKNIQTILNNDSANYEAWRQKGNLLAFLRDTAGAIRALETSFQSYPQAANGLALANLYAETKNEKAVALCNSLLATDSLQQLADANYIKGNYYSRTGNTQGAVQQYDSCILRDWKFTDAYIDKGILLFKQEKLPEALETFRLAATVSNTYPDAYFWIGRCREEQGDEQEAIENYRNAVALDPSFNEARKRIDRLEKKD